MENILLVSHGGMAAGVKTSLEMIAGKQNHVSTVSLNEDGDNIQFEEELKRKMKTLNGSVLIIADLLGGTPCNVALKNYSEDTQVKIIAGMSLSMVIEAAINKEISSQELVNVAKEGISDVKAQMGSVELSHSKQDKSVDLTKFEEYKGLANIVNVRIDERLIHGQVAGIWSTSLDTQRIIVANDEAATDSLQKTSLRMAAPTSMRLSVLTVEDAAKNIEMGKYGKQRIFLLFKNPSDVLNYVNAGGKLENLNVGNMSFKEGTREVTKSIQITEAEELIFEELSSKGIKITAQLVPNDPSIDFIEKMRR